MIGPGKMLAAAVGALSASALSSHTNLSWLISARHAAAIAIGLTIGSFYRISFRQHAPHARWAQWVGGEVALYCTNYFLAFIATYFLATLASPLWPEVAMVSFTMGLMGHAWANALARKLKAPQIDEKDEAPPPVAAKKDGAVPIALVATKDSTNG